MGDLSLLTTHTENLIATARTLTDPQAPTLCVGWSRGHVLTHLARNADGLAGLCRAALDGTGETMYHSNAARDADIESGSIRSLAELVDDVERSAAGLAPLLERVVREQPEVEVERTPGGPRFASSALSALRLREVVYHHVDLAAGFTFADVEPDLVARFIDDEDARLDPVARRAARSADLLWRARGLRTDTLGAAEGERMTP